MAVRIAALQLRESIGHFTYKRRRAMHEHISDTRLGKLCTLHSVLIFGGGSRAFVEELCKNWRESHEM